MHKLLYTILLFTCSYASAQNSYPDSLKKFRDDYIGKHEVVKGEKKTGLSFFPIQASSRVQGRFEAMKETKWVTMETSSGSKKTYRIYGYVHFTWNNKACRLTIYQPQSLMQSEEYKDYLFIPFADDSNEDSSYEAGRYIDLRTSDIVDNNLLLDFNKAYNPYCAYVSGKYNCPVPLKENFLPVRIEAGEKKYKGH